MASISDIKIAFNKIWESTSPLNNPMEIQIFHLGLQNPAAARATNYIPTEGLFTTAQKIKVFFEKVLFTMFIIVPVSNRKFQRAFQIISELKADATALAHVSATKALQSSNSADIALSAARAAQTKAMAAVQATFEAETKAKNFVIEERQDRIKRAVDRATEATTAAVRSSVAAAAAVSRANTSTAQVNTVFKAAVKEAQDQAIAARKLRNHKIEIIPASYYTFPEQQANTIARVKQIAKEGDLSDKNYLAAEYESLSKESTSKRIFHTLLAIDKDDDDKIVGYIQGEVRKKGIVKEGNFWVEVPEDNFYVHRLAVANDFRSDKEIRSNEKVGTKLMLAAMAKTKELGENLLCLEFNSGERCYDYTSDEHEEECKRRCEFYGMFQSKFNIPTSGGLMESRGWSSCTYTLTDFVYKKALEILNLPKGISIALNNAKPKEWY